MLSVSVNMARKQFANLIGRVERGRSVAITRRGEPVVQMAPIQPFLRPRLPDLTEFRESLGTPPRKAAATIRRLREQERY